MGASRRARRSMERKRINAARREYRRRARQEAEDAKVWSEPWTQDHNGEWNQVPLELDVEDFTPEDSDPYPGALVESEVVEDPLPEPVAAFRRITGR